MSYNYTWSMIYLENDLNFCSRTTKNFAGLVKIGILVVQWTSFSGRLCQLKILQRSLNMKDELSLHEQFQAIVDIYKLLPRNVCSDRTVRYDFNTRHLCHALHCKRYELLCKLPTRKRHGLLHTPVQIVYISF